MATAILPFRVGLISVQGATNLCQPLSAKLEVHKCDSHEKLRNRSRDETFLSENQFRRGTEILYPRT
ncbi:hypothetical protein [Kamptonema formosum]|uniref:hypothetical protein n=1 Tax=Kamptonema formosum TaxID=331992 RepID=UPI0012DE6876|nr:hypothetical protein [Oscillatoria sp. PCC 10802]